MLLHSLIFNIVSQFGDLYIMSPFRNWHLMLSEIMMVNLGVYWCEDTEDKNQIVLCAREIVFYDPNRRVLRFVLED